MQKAAQQQAPGGYILPERRRRAQTAVSLQTEGSASDNTVTSVTNSATIRFPASTGGLVEPSIWRVGGTSIHPSINALSSDVSRATSASVSCAFCAFAVSPCASHAASGYTASATKALIKRLSRRRSNSASSGLQSNARCVAHACFFGMSGCPIIVLSISCTRAAGRLSDAPAPAQVAILGPFRRNKKLPCSFPA